MESTSSQLKNNLEKTIKFLETKEKVLFLTTSNRKDKNIDDVPKSTQLAYHIQELVGMKKIKIIEVPKLKIYVCEGNVSSANGNGCGKKESLLKDKDKNPSGYHRCWCSLNNKDDELWKISKELFESDCVVFFGSVRWGQTNSIYQKLIERLNWINNRFIPYGEENIIKDISSGFIIIGQHKYGDDIAELQYNNHEYYGFNVNKELYWNWNAEDIEFDDETLQGYLDSYPEFFDEFKIKIK
jgi:multimeric flavodoxin WrbA